MKDTVLPLVSIIIPTYKRAHFLQRAIDSVLNQIYENIEVVVVDDNNPDSEFRANTESMMAIYHDNPKVLYVRHPKNRNGAAARNTGIKSAHGEYIAFLDDDDWYLPEKIELQVNYLLQHPEFDAVYCGYERADKIKSPYKTGDLSFELLSGVELIYTNTIMMRRSCALACGGWDERFRRNQEAVFLLHYFACGGKIGAVPDILVKYDISDASNRSNPTQFEKDFDFYLQAHQTQIDACSARYSDARQMIYSYRYRGVLLNYIKYGKLLSALRLYLKATRLLSVRFTIDCLRYVKRRLLKQPLFKEFEKEN